MLMADRSEDVVTHLPGATGEASAQATPEASLTLLELLALPDARVVAELQRRLDTKERERSLSRAELAIVCPLDFDAQMKKGGFKEFFFSESGHRAAETATALRDIGMSESARLCTIALKAFPGAPERDIAARRKQLLALSAAIRETWSSLDRDYFRLGAQIERWVVRFARSHTADLTL
jgi:hypothetical protein